MGEKGNCLLSFPLQVPNTHLPDEGQVPTPCLPVYPPANPRFEFLEAGHELWSRKWREEVGEMR